MLKISIPPWSSSFVIALHLTIRGQSFRYKLLIMTVIDVFMIRYATYLESWGPYSECGFKSRLRNTILKDFKFSIQSILKSENESY